MTPTRSNSWKYRYTWKMSVDVEQTLGSYTRGYIELKWCHQRVKWRQNVKLKNKFWPIRKSFWNIVHGRELLWKINCRVPITSPPGINDVISWKRLISLIHMVITRSGSNLQGLLLVVRVMSWPKWKRSMTPSKGLNDATKSKLRKYWHWQHLGMIVDHHLTLECDKSEGFSYRLLSERSGIQKWKYFLFTAPLIIA